VLNPLKISATSYCVTGKEDNNIVGRKMSASVWAIYVCNSAGFMGLESCTLGKKCSCALSSGL